MKLSIYLKLVLVCTTVFSLVSCKKTINERDYPFNEIKSFTIKDASGASLAAAVDNQTLTLYWPGYTSPPDSIAPAIVVSDRAKISPESGKKVALKDGLTYTVTAQNGTAVVYKLKLVNNQPPPQLNNEDPIAAAQYTELNLNGRVNYLIPEQAKTKAYLVDGSGKETQLMLRDLGRTNLNLFVDTYDQKNLPAPGKYKIKIVSGDKSITSKTDFITIEKAAFPPPYLFNAGVPLKFKRGSRVTLPFRNLDGNTITLVSLDQIGLLNIVGPSPDGKGLIVDIPEDHTLGEFYLFTIYFTHQADEQNGEIVSPMSISPIIITE